MRYKFGLSRIVFAELFGVVIVSPNGYKLNNSWK